jgi:hypothetical protein
VYITKLPADGHYIVKEIAMLPVPTSIEDLSGLTTLSNLAKLVTITTAFWSNCYVSVDAKFIDDNQRPTLRTSEF